MAIPIVKIKWDEAVNAPPSYQVVRFRKYAPGDSSQKTEFTPVASGSANYTLTDNAITEPAYYNKVWGYKIVSLCADVEDRPEIEQQTVSMTCPQVVTLTHTSDTVNYSFHNVGGDVDKYDIQLFAGAIQIGLTQSKIPPFATPIVGFFTGLTGSTNYTVKITSIIQGTAYTKECSYNVTTDPSDNGYSIENLRNTAVSNIRLYIGNNNTSPDTLIYDGSYDIDHVITGVHGSLPAVNANVRMVITHAIPITTGSANGTPATPTGTGTYTLQWSGVNSTGSSLVMTFTPAATYFVNWYMDRTSAPSNTYGKLTITLNGVSVVNNTGGTYVSGSFPAYVGATIVASTVYAGEPGTALGLLIRQTGVPGNILFNAGGAHATLSHTLSMPAYGIEIIGLAAAG